MRYRHLTILFVLASLCVVYLSRCRSLACQSGPTPLRFRPLASNGGEQITSTNASKVTLRYYVNGQPATIENLSVQPPLFSTYDLVEKARRGTDTTQFYLSVKDKPLGVLQLRTYIDSSPCDGWVHASEVRFNGKVITSTAAPFYAFELTVP